MNEQAKSHDLTIIVNTCDAYIDVLEIFFRALQDCWVDCPYPIVVNTESLTHDYPARFHLHANRGGVDDWGARLRSTLQSVNTEYVLMLYDDFILDAPVSNHRMQEAVGLLKMQASAVVAYLINTALPLSNEDSNDTFIALKERTEYCLNSAPGIWRREALIYYTKAGDTPWAWEVFGSYRCWGRDQIFYSLNPRKLEVFPYNHKKGGAIYRGKWVREVVEKAAEKYSLKIDWTLRGFSSDIVSEKRSFIWKLRFIQTGFRMVGFKALYFLAAYIREKVNA